MKWSYLLYCVKIFLVSFLFNTFPHTFVVLLQLIQLFWTVNSLLCSILTFIFACIKHRSNFFHIPSNFFPLLRVTYKVWKPRPPYVVNWCSCDIMCNQRSEPRWSKGYRERKGAIWALIISAVPLSVVVTFSTHAHSHCSSPLWIQINHPFHASTSLHNH